MTVTAWREIREPDGWDAALRALPAAHVLQAWAWGDFKSRWGWTPERWLLSQDDSPQAAVQLLRRRVGPLCVLYAPKGPVARDLAGYAQALEWIERRARASRAVWAKVDGDPASLLRAATDGPGAHVDSLGELRAMLGRRGWRYSAQQVQFRNTLLSGVDASDESILARMKPKWRYNVRLAERRGVTVRAAREADFPLLAEIYAETGRRDGFATRDSAYYLDAWRSLPGCALIAEREGSALAGLVLFAFANRAWYFYGMSRGEGREHMPAYALQFAAMRWARDHGFAVYDWWGAPERLEESDPMWGVYRFKEGFGAAIAEGIGAWDFAPVPALHALLARLRSASA